MNVLTTCLDVANIIGKRTFIRPTVAEIRPTVEELTQRESETVEQPTVISMGLFHDL